MIYPSSALYFLSIEFQNEDFLRRSLLYWDKIKRIVPEGYLPNDSDFIKELTDAGMVQNIVVSYNTLEVVADRFVSQLKSPNRAAGLSLTSYNLHSDDKEYVRLHHSKIYFVLQDILKEIGYMPQFPDKNGFYHVEADLTGYYMLVLAFEEAKRRRIQLATDSNEIWSITPSFIEENNIAEHSADTDNVTCLTSMAIENILPSNVSRFSSLDIIRLAKDSSDARKSLREHIGSLIERIQTIDSQEQANDELKELMDEIERDKTEFRNSRKFWHSEEFTSCLNVSIPTLATLFSLDSGNPVFAIGAAAFTFIQYIRNCHQLKKKRNASYQAYLVGLDKSTSSYLPYQTAIRLNEFIYD